MIITVMNIPCTWSKGSVRFFSAGMYFNTTVSSPLYCIVASMLLSTCTNIHNLSDTQPRSQHARQQADSGSYLWLQSVPVLYLRIKLPGVKGQLHLSQEAVVSKAVVVPHGDLQGPSLQLRVADHVLHNTGETYC